MHWDDVRVFLAVCEKKSLAIGAKDAGLDRSTASRRIAALETALGSRLFLRTRDGLRPSPAGLRLQVHAQRMADEARAFRASAEDTSSVVGRVRVATTESIAAMLVREGLLRLRERHPRLELELLGGNRVLDLARGEADLGLRVVKVAEPSLKVRRVAKLPFALFASEAYVRQRGRPRTDAELAGHDVITMAAELANLPESRWLEARPGVHVVLRTSSMTAMLTAILDGFGVGAVTGPWGERELSLCKLMDLPHIPARPLFLVMHPDAASRPAVRAVADAITAIFANGGTTRVRASALR